jgi:two-component system, OmpR family, alkaline phosphatase synthesis response regulator PhoP
MGTAREVDMMTADRRRVLPGAGQPGRPRLGRVLLVEDEQDVAELIRYNLTKEGYDVVLSGNGNDALRLAREHRPDVILLDIMVPQLNGWEVCRRLKKDPDLPAIPVIMVSGRVEEGDKVLGFEVGAADRPTPRRRRRASRRAIWRSTAIASRCG